MSNEVSLEVYLPNFLFDIAMRLDGKQVRFIIVDDVDAELRLVTVDDVYPIQTQFTQNDIPGSTGFILDTSLGMCLIEAEHIEKFDGQAFPFHVGNAVWSLNTPANTGWYIIARLLDGRWLLILER
jgi:hypothetical protein